ncbi:MAG TPA: cytochrome c oxidase assembly protein [Candidatus Eisenbacteria bacterium]|nr:cytochrome c oxidase assembly protein [Candidatus Eisenbacteria bacterium]
MILHIPDSLLASRALDRFGRPIPPFDWRVWENHNSTIIGIAVLAALYLWAIGPMRRRAGIAERAGGWQIVSFFSGLLVMYFALNGPIHDLSDYYLFSVHMVQHLLLTQLMPPLLLLGLPGFALRPLVGPPAVLAIARVLTRPPVAFALYTLSFTGWHLQPAYDLMMRNHNVHIVTHLQFMVTAMIMWWPILSPLREVPRMSYGGQMLYLFLIGIPMMVVAALITLAEVVLYPWYSASPRVWGLSPLDDQKLGGITMWVPGGLFYWVVMSFVFFAWVRRERREDQAEAAIRERGVGPEPVAGRSG